MTRLFFDSVSYPPWRITLYGLIKLLFYYELLTVADVDAGSKKFLVVANTYTVEVEDCISAIVRLD